MDLLLEKKNRNMRESEEGEKEIKHFNLFLQILGVPSVRIRRAKSESSSTRRVLHVSTRNTGFLQRFKRGVREIKGFGFRKCP